MNTRANVILAFFATALTVCIAAAPAAAEPALSLGLTRTTIPLTHSDERLAYRVTVKNTANENASAGDTLTCAETAPPSPTLEIGFQWLRNGSPIPGASAVTYTVTSEDEGKSLQCMATATRDPDGDGGAYAPISSVDVSLPPTPVAPQPTPPPPTGTSGPFLGGPSAAAPVATATTTAGSNVLTNVITAKGTGTLTAGSKIVTGLTTTTGAFVDPTFFRQEISGTGIVGRATGTGTLHGVPGEKSSGLITGVTTSTGEFVVGQTIEGPGLNQASRIIAVGPGTLEIEPGSGSAGPVSLTAYTTVNAVGFGTLELSVPATASGSQELFAGALPFNFNHKVSGPGIPAGTTINGYKGQTLTLSANATASASGVTITGTSEETCSVPSGWSGAGLTWSLQWLRNGTPIPGATGPSYVVQHADTEPPSLLQCKATAKDAAGAEAIAISNLTTTEPEPPAPYSTPSPGSPVVTFANKTVGKITVEAELPAGTQVLRVSGSEADKLQIWSCAKLPPRAGLPSTAKCSREDSLQPGASYPAIELIAQVFANAPDTLKTKVMASGGNAPDPAIAEDEVTGILPAVPFGFKAFETEVLDEAGADFTQAGGHPHEVGASLQFTEHVRAEKSPEAGLRAANGSVRLVRTDTPMGFVGNPQVVTEKCQSVAEVVQVPSTCPAASAIGGIDLETELGPFKNQPIYLVEPEFGTPAQLAFGVGQLHPGFGYTLTPELRPKEGYAISVVAAPVQKTPELFGAKVTLCDLGAKVRVAGLSEGGGETKFDGCRKAGEGGANDIPFLSLPTRCGDPASSTTTVSADTWEERGKFARAQFTGPALTGCNALSFSPTLKARPTTAAADSPTGLEVDLRIPQDQDSEGTATAHLKKTVVTLPEGLVINPSGANGLDACTSAQIGLGSNDPPRCPDSSKIGAVEIETPLLDHALPGSVYIASPHDNPFNSLLALYIVVNDPRTGTVVKLPGQVEPNPATGQLTTTFDENPQLPVEDVALKIRGGASAPLRTPASCAKYTTTSQLTPWSAPDSGPPVTAKDSWAINRGPGGGACASAQPNAPGFEAGTVSPIAAAYTPFVVKLRREDGSQAFSTVSITPPPGLLGKLAGIPYCPDSALAAAAAKSGRAEQASPSCPSASQVGSVVAGAGAGPAPYYASGNAYLTGPYKGAPLSLAIITPAVAGPFDLGTVVIRTALQIDPESARITAVSDPIPQILQGIPLDIRSVAISMDRPSFTLNPTSCDPMAVTGSLTSATGNTAALNNRFQVAECSRLGFKPSLAIKLRGATKRSGHPALSATLTYPKGAYANIASASVALPHSEFLEQAHIRTICTRVQFAADACPQGAIYGKATATTPLLDQPLTGPVYLRSSSNPLPDLVVDLRGQIHVALVGRIDSVNGGIRTTFDSVPDAPVSKFTLQMQGGKKGLLVNSRDVCKTANRATAEFTAQNGKTLKTKPLLKAKCPKRSKRHKQRYH